MLALLLTKNMEVGGRGHIVIGHTVGRSLWHIIERGMDAEVEVPEYWGRGL